MSRLDTLFNTKRDICSIFTTAGFPNLDSTVSTVLELEKAGADLVEIGIPFSDPLADGPVIQESSAVAIENGIDIETIFQQVSEIREQSEIPIVLMGYFNPVFKYGIEKFLSECNRVGVDGLIIPDLYPELYEKDYQDLFEAAGVPLVFLVTTETEKSRVEYIDRLSNSFIYLLSSSSTTGKTRVYSEEDKERFERFNQLEIDAPVLLGFGIHNAENFETAFEYFNGGIIGSAFIKSQMTSESTEDFIQKIRATHLV